MAAKKKKPVASKSVASSDEFIALASECGGDKQLTPVDAYGTKVHKTEAAAIKEAVEDVQTRSDNSDTPCSYATAKIVKRGKSTGLVWK